MVCPVDQFKCNERPVFSHAAAQGVELEWKGNKQRPDRNTGSNPAGNEDLHPWRNYIIVCSSQPRQKSAWLRIRIKTSSGAFPLISGDFRSSWDEDCILFMSDGDHLSFHFHSCPFQLSSLLLFPRPGMSGCREGKVRALQPAVELAETCQIQKGHS